MAVRSTLLAFCILIVLTISALVLSGRVSATRQNTIAQQATSSTMRSPRLASARVMSRSAGASEAASERTMTDSVETANEIAAALQPDASRRGANNSKLAFSSVSDKGTPQQQQQIRSEPEEVPMIGPVSQDRDLRDLPDIPQVENEADQRLTRHPPSTNPARMDIASDPLQPVRLSAQAVAMPTPSATYAGITSAQSACGCLPPDTDGDIGSNYYIQAVNSRLKIIDKAGNQLLAPTTYNTFFSALGTSTPCGNNQNDGDAVVFYDHVANRWVVSDFAFGAFPGTAFYQCIGVSKTPDPVSGGWWLYALQVDPSNNNYLGDYPKFGVWSDGYYMSVNLFSNNTTFNGVRVYALPRNQMINGTGAPTPAAIAFTIDPTTLGDAYSLLPATFRTGSAPPAGEAEYFMAINSPTDGATVENQVFTWRFHADFANPANSTFGTGANHAPDATITVNNFVDAIQGSGASETTLIVPQTGTIRLLDTLGDKLMYPLVYQNLNGAESIYAAHTINNNQNGTGPTAIRWYQFNVTGNTIPATPTQQQTFNNNADGLWRFMPSLNVDAHGNMTIGYSESSSSTNPAIAYAGRLANDTQSTLAQGEATLIAGAGHQTNSSGRWGDYSATFVDPQDGCTFWHTNEYYSATGSTTWNTLIGNFKFSQCTPTCTSVPHIKTSDFDGGVKSNVIVWQGSTTGQWVLLDNTNTQRVLATWGGTGLGDVAVPGDYDGDGKTDIAVFRPSEGNWYVLKSTGGATIQGWGLATDVPVPGDYDGDGKTDYAVFRPTEGNWYILKSTGGLTIQGWGTNGDKPVPGDYDNDGRTDVAVFRPSEGNWYVKKSAGGQTIQGWGLSTDQLVPADYDGDGRTDFAIFRPTEGNWYIINSCSGTVTIRNWGTSSDRPVPADFDGDGKADIAVWRASEGNWYIIKSSTNSAQIRNLGLSNDTPVALAYLPQ